MTERVHIAIRGAVQGVGFRPFVYRLAKELQLNGWVNNSPQGVFIEVEGVTHRLAEFLLRIEKERPPRSSIHSIECTFLDTAGYSGFEIRKSDTEGERTALVLPDIATCPECLRDVFDPSNRRYLYPFTNCTNCGPRFSIILGLPYDRSNTTMKVFTMCRECRDEYEDPLDRRFHAQPNACPACGPQLELWDETGKSVASFQEALLRAAELLRGGLIVAVKGLGGFQLLVDARNEDAVLRLRKRKHREEKPFALMYPSLESVKLNCEVSDLEERLLLSPESPIVLLQRLSEQPGSSVIRPAHAVAPSAAPRNPFIGAMLPYTPLHHVLMSALRFPVVCTSGNLSDEPICVDQQEAGKRLAGIADAFLVHDRPIARHVDDSVVRVMLGRESVMRRARGYAPLPIAIGRGMPQTVALGAHLKNTVAVTSGNNVFVSQHIGDLETIQAFDAFQTVHASLIELFAVEPERVVCDLHPDYLSSQFAKRTGLPVIEVQHHYAHVAACMAENRLDGKVLGVSWDGTGYGLDGTVWGGEFLLTTATGFTRAASMRPFRLPGASKAIKEPRRAALGVLYEMFGERIVERRGIASLEAFTPEEATLIRTMLSKAVNSPLTTSVGRLFDAVASITGLRQVVNFEGQAAMELEFALERGVGSTYGFRIRQGGDPSLVVDWTPMIREILTDLAHGVSVPTIAAKFHNTLVEMIVDVAKSVGEARVVLTGGCFQNKYLTERSVVRLRESGFRAYWHQRIPPNDGGISLGQAAAAARLQPVPGLPEQKSS